MAQLHDNYLIQVEDLKNIMSQAETISDAVDVLHQQLPFSKHICDLIVKDLIKDNGVKLIDDQEEIDQHTQNIINQMSTDEVEQLQKALSSVDSKAKNQLISQLQKDKMMADSTIRSKDKIIAAATDKIQQLEKELQTILEEEEKEEIQMGAMAKDRAKKLLQERVQHKMESALIKNVDSVEEKEEKIVKANKDLREMLIESCSIETDATSIIQSRGVLAYEFSNKDKRDIYTLNMNNRYAVLNRLSKQEYRIQFMQCLAYSIVDKNQIHNKVEKVLLNNLWLEDKLFVPFMNILLDNIEYFYVAELSINCSKIFIAGAKKLCELISLNLTCLKYISWQENKKDIPTKVIKEDILPALEKNTNITKLSLFQLNIQQYKDTKERIMRRNNDIAREIRNEMMRKKI